MDRTFIDYQPTPEDCWRGIILFGRNVASYKFALLLALAVLVAQRQVELRIDTTKSGQHQLL